MTIQSSEMAAPQRRRLPGPLRLLLAAWVVAAVFGALTGLALAVTSLAANTLGASVLARSVSGLVSGAFSGSLLVLVLAALYYAIWALLRLGQRILKGSAGPLPSASRPAANGVWPGIVGAGVGVAVGLIAGGVLGFVAILVWIITDTTDSMMIAQAPFWGVVFGVLWGVPAGAFIGALAGIVMGFVAGFRLGRRAVVPLPAV